VWGGWSALPSYVHDALLSGNHLQTTCGGANGSLFARMDFCGFPPISQRV